jgi:hypothetical protein
MKDHLLLLAVAMVASIVAWFFWHFFGDGSFSIISMIALVALLADNIRMRRQLKAIRQSVSSHRA